MKKIGYYLSKRVLYNRIGIRIPVNCNIVPPGKTKGVALSENNIQDFLRQSAIFTYNPREKYCRTILVSTLKRGMGKNFRKFLRYNPNGKNNPNMECNASFFIWTLTTIINDARSKDSMENAFHSEGYYTYDWISDEILKVEIATSFVVPTFYCKEDAEIYRDLLKEFLGQNYGYKAIL